jgi:hypothetical protein
VQLAELELRLVDPLMHVRNRELSQVAQREHAPQVAKLLDRLAAARQHRECRTDLAHTEGDRAGKLRVL